jgi:hypothetical protein
MRWVGRKGGKPPGTLICQPCDAYWFERFTWVSLELRVL